jgi:hypothetical protein
MLRSIIAEKTKDIQIIIVNNQLTKIFLLIEIDVVLNNTKTPIMAGKKIQMIDSIFIF